METDLDRGKWDQVWAQIPYCMTTLHLLLTSLKMTQQNTLIAPGSLPQALKSGY